MSSLLYFFGLQMLMNVYNKTLQKETVVIHLKSVKLSVILDILMRMFLCRSTSGAVLVKCGLLQIVHASNLKLWKELATRKYAAEVEHSIAT